MTWNLEEEREGVGVGGDEATEALEGVRLGLRLTRFPCLILVPEHHSRSEGKYRCRAGKTHPKTRESMEIQERERERERGLKLTGIFFVLFRIGVL